MAHKRDQGKGSWPTCGEAEGQHGSSHGERWGRGWMQGPSVHLELSYLWEGKTALRSRVGEVGRRNRTRQGCKW